MDTIQLARQLGHAIQQEESYKAAVAASEAVDADKELTALISEFSEKRDSIAETQDKAKLEELDKELEELYNQITEHPKMIAFEQAKRDFAEIMDRVVAIITKSADGENPDTAEPDTGCSGNCQSCAGGCG